MADNDSGTFVGAGIAGSVAFGVASWKGKKTPGIETPDIRPSTKVDLVNQIRQAVGDPNSLRNLRMERAMRFLDNLQNNMSSYDLSSEFIAREWEAAIQAAIPNPAELHAFPVKAGENVAFNVHAIKSTLKGNASLFTFDAFKRFKANMSMFQREAGIVGRGYLTDTSRAITNEFMKNYLTPMVSMRDEFALGNVAGYGPLKAPLSDRLIKTLDDIRAVTGTDYSLERRSVQGMKFGEVVARFGDQMSLFLPETFGPEGNPYGGLMRRGVGLQNVYSPGMFAVLDASKGAATQMDYAEFKAWTVLNALKNNEGGSMRGAFNTAIEKAELIAEKMAEFQEPVLEGENFNLLTKWRANQLTVVDSMGDLLDGKDLRNVVLNSQSLFNQQLYPASSKKSRFSVIDPTDAYGPLAEIGDPGRKMWQYIKPFESTDEAVQAMRSMEFGGKEWDFLEGKMALEHGTFAPRVKAAFVSADQIAQLQNAGYHIGDGELLYSNAPKVRKAFQARARKSIELVEVSEVLSKRIMETAGIQMSQINSPTRFQNPISMNVPAIIGRTRYGDLVRGPNNWKITGMAPSASRGDSAGGMRLFYEEIHDAADAQKFFGMKGMGRATQFDSRVAEILGLGPKELNSISAIIPMSDLEKNPHALALQRFSALTDLSQRVSTSPLSSELASNPKKFLDAITSGLSDLNPAEARQATDWALINLASELNLPPEAAGRVFGSETTAATGLARLSFGGIKEGTGAGNIGTLESRIFTLLEGSSMGKMSKDISQEFQKRLAINDPERLLINQELTKTMKSITGQLEPDKMVKPWAMSKDEIGKFFQDGGFMATGLDEGPKGIYVPGYGTLDRMKPMKDPATGIPIVGNDIRKDVQNLLYEIRDKGQGDVDAKRSLHDYIMGTSNNQRNSFLARVHTHQALAGKGAGSLARGELLGSRVLTAMSSIPETDDLPDFYSRLNSMKDSVRQNVVGIPMKYADQILDDMSEIYGPDEVVSMRSKLWAGEAIPGMVGRHPFIGQYSIQPVYFMGVHTKEPVMIVPETSKKFRIATAHGEVVKDIQTSILKGLGADKDADTLLAIGLTKANAKQVQHLLDNGGQYMDDYASHNAAMQLLKMPKSGVDAGMSLQQMMAGSASKLVTAQSQVGRISLALTKARAAVVNSNLDKNDVTRSLSLLEWLEQQPISAKHLNIADVLSGSFERQLNDIQFSIKKGQPDFLHGTVKEMIGYNKLAGADKDIADLVLGGGEFNLVGEGQTIKAKGLDLARTSQIITDAMQEFSTSGTDIQSLRMHEMMRGDSFSRADVDAYLRGVDLSGDMPAKTFADRNRALMAELNTGLASIKNRVRPYAKPAAIGLAVAAGAGLFLSGSPSELGPSAPRPEAEVSRPANQARDLPEVEAREIGSPSTPPQHRNRSWALNNQSYKQRQSVRAQIQARNLNPGQKSLLMERLSNQYPGSNLNVTVRDDRRSLNRTTLSDMIGE